ncbi:nuclear pore complex protein NUP58 [Oryza brachyantha]|uniref:nuclear pore complex protein NUP58 n=1 Tax=Oryza brachyantha TaxID=4533 RepID=UPI001AD979FD|nr:nuclear pore complex protein NUP58 [Oryza brachyantha]XP_040383494.1 nuclear pore complex protein NUP58 [Oryza brachyantha]
MAFSFASPAPQNPFQTPAQTPSLSPSPFQFSLPQPQQQPPQQQLAAPSAQPPQQQLMLYTTDGKPAGYNTKWEELHSESQKALLQIEDKIREYRDESERLDQCSRLHDSSISNVNFEHDASEIAQELGGTTTMMEREKASVQELMTVVNEMMRNTEFSIRSYMMLRPRFIRPGVGANGSGSNPSGPAGAQSNQPVAVAPTIDFYSGIPKRPSLFMQQTINKFEKYLGECCKWIAELEQLVQMENNKRQSASLESLPKVMSNVHDYFIYVASKVENLHQYVESLKTEYLHEQRRMGNANDPFLEANRREAAKQEAAARRVHPTLHLPAPVQPTTQIAGTATSQPQQSLIPSGATSSSAFPSFSTPVSAPSSSSLFSTPTLSSNLFGSSGSAPLSTPFGTVSTPTLGSTPAPSGFGNTTPSFASTPAIGGTSLFSTPFGGVATASGSSFGGTSKVRSKPRGRR